jgi:hypothetical protein
MLIAVVTSVGLIARLKLLVEQFLLLSDTSPLLCSSHAAAILPVDATVLLLS